MLIASLHGHSDVWSYEPPSDVDIEEVTKEVMGKLHDDWVMLQSYLGIPEHVMYQLTRETCERNKIRAMLKEWRNMSSGSRAQLAECLYGRLTHIYTMQLNYWCLRMFMCVAMDTWIPNRHKMEDCIYAQLQSYILSNLDNCLNQYIGN